MDVVAPADGGPPASWQPPQIPGAQGPWSAPAVPGAFSPQAWQPPALPPAGGIIPPTPTGALVGPGGNQLLSPQLPPQAPAQVPVTIAPPGWAHDNNDFGDWQSKGGVGTRAQASMIVPYTMLTGVPAQVAAGKAPDSNALQGQALAANAQAAATNAGVGPALGTMPSDTGLGTPIAPIAGAGGGVGNPTPAGLPNTQQSQTPQIAPTPQAAGAAKPQGQPAQGQPQPAPSSSPIPGLPQIDIPLQPGPINSQQQNAFALAPIKPTNTTAEAYATAFSMTDVGQAHLEQMMKAGGVLSNQAQTITAQLASQGVQPTAAQQDLLNQLNQLEHLRNAYRIMPEASRMSLMISDKTENGPLQVEQRYQDLLSKANQSFSAVINHGAFLHNAEEEAHATAMQQQAYADELKNANDAQRLRLENQTQAGLAWFNAQSPAAQRQMMLEPEKYSDRLTGPVLHALAEQQKDRLTTSMLGSSATINGWTANQVNAAADVSAHFDPADPDRALNEFQAKAAAAGGDPNSPDYQAAFAQVVAARDAYAKRYSDIAMQFGGRFPGNEIAAEAKARATGVVNTRTAAANAQAVAASQEAQDQMAVIGRISPNGEVSMGSALAGLSVNTQLYHTFINAVTAENQTRGAPGEQYNQVAAEAATKARQDAYTALINDAVATAPPQSKEALKKALLAGNKFADASDAATVLAYAKTEPDAAISSTIQVADPGDPSPQAQPITMQNPFWQAAAALTGRLQAQDTQTGAAQTPQQLAQGLSPSGERTERSMRGDKRYAAMMEGPGHGAVAASARLAFSHALDTNYLTTLLRMSLPGDQQGMISQFINFSAAGAQIKPNFAVHDDPAGQAQGVSGSPDIPAIISAFEQEGPDGKQIAQKIVSNLQAAATLVAKSSQPNDLTSEAISAYIAPEGQAIRYTDTGQLLTARSSMNTVVTGYLSGIVRGVQNSLAPAGQPELLTSAAVKQANQSLIMRGLAPSPRMYESEDVPPAPTPLTINRGAAQLPQPTVWDQPGFGGMR